MATVKLDQPVYGVGQAARILGLSTPKVRNWLDGYTRSNRSYEPVVRETSTGSEVVTWGEFVELGYLREFRSAGVSLQRMRPVIAELRKMLGTTYPLAQSDLYVDHREVVLRLQDEFGVGTPALMIVRTGVGMLDLSVGARSFIHKIEFDPGTKAAVSLYPAGKTSPVRVSPNVAFGMPAVSNVATERLFELWTAEEENTEWLAHVYGLEQATIEAAIAYEVMAQAA